MRTILILAVLAMSVPAASAQSHLSKPRCSATAELAKYRGGARVEPLNKQPPATHIRAVLRSVDGCLTPVVVRERVGDSTPRR